MPRTFIHDDFLLGGDAARALYHTHAARQPIYDYHCHLPAADLASDRCFADLFEAWLEGDHYKWRAMRACGIDERFCTGDASPRDKFLAFASVVPRLLGNPLHHWTHLELVRYFGITDTLDADSAPQIWETANRQLADLPISAILDRFDVALIGTTDDPADPLTAHHALRADPIGRTTVIPAFRPDKLYNLDAGNVTGWAGYVDRIAGHADADAETFDGFRESLARRVRQFHDAGGRLADHGLACLPTELGDDHAAASIYQQLRRGVLPDARDRERWTSWVLMEVHRLYHEHGWATQFHLGALRNNNRWAHEHLGPDTGFDSMGDFPQAEGLRTILGELAGRRQLPPTILYNHNPRDNHLFATMCGNFNGGPTGQPTRPGHMQFGSGWWFLDQRDGMAAQMRTLMAIGTLSTFVGMVTDSRSFLSFPRHEYFRRVLCDVLGRAMEDGELPDDMDAVGSMVRAIAFGNAARYFEIPLHADYDAVCPPGTG